MADEALDNLDTSSSDTTQTAVVEQQQDITTAHDDVTVAATQTWPDNWRQEMAGDDEKELKRLERFKSPNDVFKSFREIEKLKSSFTPPPKVPDKDSTPEEIKAYRDHLGIPESAKDYDLSMEDGTVFGEDMMPHIQGFLEFAHSKNTPPGQVKEILQWYAKDIEAEQDRVAELNEAAKVDGMSTLKAEWGAEFKGNLNSIRSLFVEAPEGVMDSLMQSSGPDGLQFGNNPDNIKWLVGLAKQLNPAAALLPSGVTDTASIDSELDKIMSLMCSTDPAEKAKYWKDPKMQERYQALLKAKENSR